MPILLGIDVGSSGCKATAVNDLGAVVATSRSHAYPTRYPHPGWAEQDPEAWYRAACAAIKDCLASDELKADQVVGLAIDGPAHNVALMDATGQILYPTIHWSDLRSTPQAERLADQMGDQIFEITYQPVNPSWTLTQLLWLRETEPAVWSRLRRILVTKDYVRYRFTGAYQTDVYDAIGTQLYDVGHNRWSAELCDLLTFPVAWLPDIAPPDAVAGLLQPVAAHDAGLPAGIPVAVGSGDSVVEAFGAGIVEPGHGLVKLGTAANVNLVTANPHPASQSLTYRHIIPGRWFTITATNAGALTLRWFRDTFCRYEMARAEAENRDVYDLIGQLATGAPPGCEGLLFHPYLMGERSPYWDPHLRGDFIGIGARHAHHHFARAVLEGVAFSIRDCLQAVAALGQPITRLHLLGGGAKSALWSQILCDILGRPLLKPAVPDASFGAALLAGVAAGLFPDWQTAVKAGVQLEQTLTPNPEAHALYNRYFDIYRAIVRDLARHNYQLVDLVRSKQ